MEIPLYQEPVQTREAPASPYELKLAGLIQTIFAEGHYELPELLKGLNDHGSTAPDGTAWTDENFCAEMKKLGA